MMQAFRLPLGAYQSMSVDLERAEFEGGIKMAHVRFEGFESFVTKQVNLYLDDVAMRDMILALDTTIDPTSRRAGAFEGRLRGLPYSLVLS